MRANRFIFLFIFHYIGFSYCGYPPMGDEVQAGSVLLPATRRGRYLANIVRRQAVDGTGIKFNKDADRMNAEAKKKVDVLSEELLPYIIAEQERRTTLYKRVMTAIQNGEKGVTIAEIRNKPPAIIRKGLMYRCPTNRAPREPDGSGAIMCEDNLDPTPIMFESCLSAEDKELYVADNKYFFCNRHKVEGPDLPRNGTSVIGCAPCERTSLNYTSQKCALEDTDDVVVHYRYYPDRTYKFVSELDPDREVCEHWNPCQVGYIFSLPGPDLATPASELWHDYTGDTDEEISREEIVPPVPEDDKNETTFPAQNYVTSTRRVLIPTGYEYQGVGKYLPNGQRTRVSRRDGTVENFDNIQVISELVGLYVKIAMIFRPMRPEDATTYYVRFEDKAKRGKFVHVPLVTLSMGQTRLTPAVVSALPAQHVNRSSIYLTCARCVLRGIMLRAADGSVSNLDLDKYRLRKFIDDKGVEQSVVELDFELVTPRDFGDYFLMIQNDDGGEERIKAFTLKAPDNDHDNAIQVQQLRLSMEVGSHVDLNMKYTCDDCEIMDLLCRGESVLAQGRAALIPTSKSVSLNFVDFEDTNACVYVGLFKVGDVIYRKVVADLENNSPGITVEGGVALLSPPAEGTHIEHKVRYKCTSDCSLTKVYVNGIPLETTSRRTNVGSVAYYLPEDSAVTIGVTEYSSAYEGIFQGVFMMDGVEITKNLLEIGLPTSDGENTIHTTPSPHSTANPEPVPEEEEPTTEGERPGDEDLTTEGESPGEEETTTEGEPSEDNESTTEEKASEDSRRKQHAPTDTRRSGGCVVNVLRDGAAAGQAYKQKSVGFTCPDGQLVAVSCRGQPVTSGLVISTNNTVNIDFDHFEDTNACVYMGIFKIGQNEHRKTLAVIENSSPMINVTESAVIPPPPTGELKHKFMYTCNVDKCDPAMIYINDKTLKSDDKPSFYSYKSEMVKVNNKEVMTVTIDLAIKPFTKEYEGVYQLVVTNGAETVTKNIMEIGALI